MDLQQLRYVVAIAELGSFTRAAERCFVVQSALSHQVARLERELGARLFHRTSRSVRLTPAGEAFVTAARQCLDAAERARAEVAAAVGEVRGRLAIGLIPTVAALDVPTGLQQFHNRYPHVSVSVRVGISEQLRSEVAGGVLDVAILGLPVGAAIEGVNRRLLAADRHVAVVASNHPLAGAKRVGLRRLAEETFVDFPAGGAGRAQSDEAFQAAGLQRTVAFEVSDAELMVRLVAVGLGVAVLPSTFVPKHPGVVTVPVVGGPGRHEYLIWSRDPAPATLAFLDTLASAPVEA
jgi:DNA-binding transcriptional LysR family regulator